MQFFLSALLTAPFSAGFAAATLTTEINYVTQFLYEQINVLVDGNGAPYSTQTISASTPIPQVATSSVSSASAVTSTTAEPANSQPNTEPADTSASSHSHAAATQNYAYISQASSTSSSTTPSTTWSTSSSTTPSSSSTTPSSTSSSWSPTTSSTSSTLSTTTSSEWTPSPTSTYSSTTSSSSSSSSQPAPTSTPGSFSGDATFYDVGLGACGTTNSDSELVAALNVDQFNQFGSMSNGNPACGKKATLNYNGKSVTVEIVDKCMGCKYGDLDLSPTAFQQLADESAGRIKMTWSFE